jgi:hypothetical protein
MKKIYTLSILILLFVNFAQAQNFNYGIFTAEDLNLKNSDVDSNASAAVIREFGNSEIRLDDATGKTYVNFTYHVKIKLFKKSGFDNGNVEIPRWIRSDQSDEISDLTGTTYNFINGEVVRTELDKKQIFTEKKTNYISLTKFTMPNLKAGSIIEYSFNMRIFNVFNFKTWEFQSNIPKLYSEYIAFLPAIYNYNISLRGPLKMTSSTAVLQKECLRISGSAVDCSKMTYIMKNIPAFVEEEHMTAASNFKSAIYFELSDIQYLNGSKTNITKTWKDVDYEVTHSQTFGGQLKKKDLFSELLPVITKNSTDELGKAKDIYKYIKSTIKWNRYNGMYCETSLKKALDTHSGNIADINLSLITALTAAGLDVEAVILSTRENGTVNNLYPVLSDFNYVIAKVNIGDKSYLVDASDPLLPFGLLPLRCINDRGRVISMKKPSYWYDLKASQSEGTRYNMMAELTTDGKLVGELVIYSTGYAALNKRKAMLEANSIDDYVEKLDNNMSKISILKHDIKNLDSLDSYLIESYKIKMDVFENGSADQLFFNPFFLDRITKNPFNLSERTYPVDLGAKSESRVNLSIKLPTAYTLADQPKDLSLGLPNQDGKYLTRTILEDNTLNFTQLFQLNKPIYESDEYFSLKELYSQIIQVQKTDIVLKKTK